MQTDMMRSSGNCQGIFDLQKGKEAKTASEVEKRGEWAMAKAQEGTRGGYRYAADADCSSSDCCFMLTY